MRFIPFLFFGFFFFPSSLRGNCHKICPEKTYGDDTNMKCSPCEDDCINCDESQCYLCEDDFLLSGAKKKKKVCFLL